jgi:ribonuclease HII
VGPDFQFEHVLWDRGVAPIAGVDEAGRGPLAGPVVAAAVIFLEPFSIPALDDSKKLGASRREHLHELLTCDPRIRWAVARIEADAIDRHNILRATHMAMAAALAQLPETAHALVDGLTAQDLPVPHDPIVGGDARSMSIAAASILAKVIRDRIMLGYDREHPIYGFAKHKGYATPEHLASLRRHGPCPIHRRSFAPVAQAGLFCGTPPLAGQAG